MLLIKTMRIQMKTSQTIQEVLTKFTDIVNKAYGLEKEFRKEETIYVILCSPISDRDSKVSVIKNPIINLKWNLKIF